MLADQGYTATTTGGATSWHTRHAEHFQGARVVLWPDRDEPGEAYAAAVAAGLDGIAADVRVLRIPDLPEHGDAADYFAGGGTGDQLDRLLAEAPPWAAAASDDGVEPSFRTLAELLERPELLEPPRATVSRLAYRGRLLLFAGPDKSGKSTLYAHAIAALTRRRPFLGEGVRAEHGRAVLVGLEEAVSDAVRRLRELDADPDRVQLLVLRPPDLRGEIDRLLSEWPADLILIDSLQEYARVTAGTIPDDGDNAGWAAIVRPLVDVARDHDIAVVLLHHVRRSDGQYRGAGEIAAAADGLLEMQMPNPGEDPTLRRVRGRGRWPVEPFALSLRDGRYELAGGTELSLDAQVLLQVEMNPGISKNRLRQSIHGRASAIDAAISQLLGRGAVEDHGTDGRSRLFPPSGQEEMAV